MAEAEETAAVAAVEIPLNIRIAFKNDQRPSGPLEERVYDMTEAGAQEAQEILMSEGLWPFPQDTKFVQDDGSTSEWCAPRAVMEFAWWRREHGGDMPFRKIGHREVLWTAGRCPQAPVALKSIVSTFDDQFEAMTKDLGLTCVELHDDYCVMAIDTFFIDPTGGKIRKVYVPGGEFLYGDKNEKRSEPSFFIAKFPTTRDEFSRFIEHRKAGGVGRDGKQGEYITTAQEQKSSYTWDNPGIPQEGDHPVVYVSWYDSTAYANWLGAKLPTEQQWEKAARGTDGRTYPWGNQDPTDELLIWSGGEINRTGTASVGSCPKGASPYGAEDMSGNVWEWTSSVWESK